MLVVTHQQHHNRTCDITMAEPHKICFNLKTSRFTSVGFLSQNFQGQWETTLSRLRLRNQTQKSFIQPHIQTQFSQIFGFKIIGQGDPH